MNRRGQALIGACAALLVSGRGAAIRLQRGQQPLLQRRLIRTEFPLVLARVLLAQSEPRGEAAAGAASGQAALWLARLPWVSGVG